MSRLHRALVATALAAVALGGVTGCTDDTATPRPSASSSSAAPDDSPAASSAAALEKLPEVDLAELATPDPAPGVSKSAIEGYAAQLRKLLASSLEDSRWWDADPGLATARSFLADVAPQTREAYLDSVEKRNGSNPASQYLVSIFDADHQPSGPPRIVKAAWRTDRVARDDGSSYERIALEAFAVYRIEGQEQPVLVRRWLQLSGEPDRSGSWPALSNYTLVDGIDTCTLYQDGTYEPVAAGTADAASFRTVLKQARTKGWVEFGLTDAQDDTPDDKRTDACADRTDS